MQNPPLPIDYAEIARTFRDLASKHRGSPDADRYARLAQQMWKIAEQPSAPKPITRCVRPDLMPAQPKRNKRPADTASGVCSKLAEEGKNLVASI